MFIYITKATLRCVIFDSLKNYDNDSLKTYANCCITEAPVGRGIRSDPADRAAGLLPAAAVAPQRAQAPRAPVLAAASASPRTVSDPSSLPTLASSTRPFLARHPRRLDERTAPVHAIVYRMTCLFWHISITMGLLI